MTLRAVIISEGYAIRTISGDAGVRRADIVDRYGQGCCGRGEGIGSHGHGN